MNINLHDNVSESFPAIRNWLCEKVDDRNFLLGILGEEKYIAYLKQFQTTNKIISRPKFAQLLWSEIISHTDIDPNATKFFKQISKQYDVDKTKHRERINQLKAHNQICYNKIINYINLIGIDCETFTNQVPGAAHLSRGVFEDFVEEVYKVYRLDSENYNNDEKIIALIKNTQGKYEEILRHKYSQYLEEMKEYEDNDSEYDSDDDKGEKVIQNGKAIQYDDLVKLMREYDNKHCRICLGDYTAIDQVLITDPCKHMFHKSCLEHWKKTTCPMCRADIKPI